MDNAIKHYDTLSKRAIQKGIVVDIFAGSID